MSEQQLNGSDVSTGFEQVDGEGVTLMPRSALRRAFLARRRGQEPCIEGSQLIRADGRKTCWTEPPGTVSLG